MDTDYPKYLGVWWAIEAKLRHLARHFIDNRLLFWSDGRVYVLIEMQVENNVDIPIRQLLLEDLKVGHSPFNEGQEP